MYVPVIKQLLSQLDLKGCEAENGSSVVNVICCPVAQLWTQLTKKCFAVQLCRWWSLNLQMHIICKWTLETIFVWKVSMINHKCIIIVVCFTLLKACSQSHLVPLILDWKLLWQNLSHWSTLLLSVGQKVVLLSRHIQLR